MEREGRPSPLRGRPSLDDDLTSYWNAFAELHSQRTAGVVPNPIQFADLLAWLRLRGYPRSTWDEVTTVVLAMDREWIKLAGENR